VLGVDAPNGDHTGKLGLGDVRMVGELAASPDSVMQTLVPFGELVGLFQLADDSVHHVNPFVKIDVAVFVRVGHCAQVGEVLVVVLLQDVSENRQFARLFVFVDRQNRVNR